jgi:hypothetical protein
MSKEKGYSSLGGILLVISIAIATFIGYHNYGNIGGIIGLAIGVILGSGFESIIREIRDSFK